MESSLKILSQSKRGRTTLQYILNVDPEKCTGCRLCEVMCSFHHEREFNPTLSRIRIAKEEELGVDIPIVCMHCTDAPCISVCSVNALSKEKDTGAVILSSQRCIGCRACMIVCPYSAIFMHPTKRIILKCDLCNGNPVCAKHCTSNALEYIRIDKLGALKRKELAKKIQPYTMAKTVISD